jgi:hypothetical protein
MQVLALTTIVSLLLNISFRCAKKIKKHITFLSNMRYYLA